MSINNSFLNILFESIPDFVFVKDENFIITNANAAFLSIYPPAMRDSVIGSTTVESYKKEEADAFLENDRIAFKEGQSEVEETLNFPDGEKRTLHTKKVRFYDSEKKPYILGIARDITELKDIQSDLEEANAELEEFAYRTSHDLRSPLLSSIKLLSMMESQLEGQETALEYLQYSQDMLKKLEGLVGDILELTRIRNYKEEETVIEPHKIIEHALDKFKYMPDFERLEINKDYQFDKKLITKPSRVKLILENLLSNAVKYQDTEKKKSLLNVKTYSEGNTFICEIEDNGVGIPKDKQDSLFEMFQRFHPRKSFGSGLGLYMVKKSATLINGDIAYKATKEGSLFTVSIPLKAKYQAKE